MIEKRIGFVSTRLAGTDGVSLETKKWSDVLGRDGHECFYMAGELDTPPDRSSHVPLAHFSHKDVLEIYDACFGQTQRSLDVTRKVEDAKHSLKQSIRDFISLYDIEMLIPENAVTIPMNLPLGVAITEFVAETGFPVIAHHHDFFWERKRFLYNACWDYLNMAFPPHLPSMRHAVLNSSQDNQLSLRTGISATIIPNVMDFACPPPKPDGYADDLREDLAIEPDTKLILQPTRIVQRKGIEHAIELIHRLKIPAVLVISHASGDEGDDYSVRVREYSDLLGVRSIFCSDIIGEERGRLDDGSKVYTLGDLYSQADLVTYPSTIEGFGNAFLETVYYRRPILVNNYTIYSFDIKPKGFRAIEIDDYVSEKTVEHALAVLKNEKLGSEMAEHNYELANRFFSFEVLQKSLQMMLMSCFGS